MSDLLAIFGPTDDDGRLLDSIAWHRPDRVTVLVADQEAGRVAEESAAGEQLRARLTGLMAAIERDTGATVVGLAGERAQLEGWRFDRELVAAEPVAA